MNLNPFTWFSSTPTDAVWTVAIRDIEYLGKSENLHHYQVVWRKGAMSLTGKYSFPSEKSLEKVLLLAKREC